jgi:simple sugar transport system substrate-binding protein
MSAVSGTQNLQVNGADDAAVAATLQAKLAQDDSVDYVVSLGAPIALDALKAIDASGSEAKLVTFDLNQETGQAIKDGKLEFAIDQQPYMQGFMAVTALYLNLKNGNDLGGGQPVLTGPSFVDRADIDQILPFVEHGTR